MDPSDLPVPAHSPEESVCSVVIDFALSVLLVQVVPGALLQDPGSHAGAPGLDGAVVDMFGGDRGHAASL